MRRGKGRRSACASIAALEVPLSVPEMICTASCWILASALIGPTDPCRDELPGIFRIGVRKVSAAYKTEGTITERQSWRKSATLTPYCIRDRRRSRPTSLMPFASTIAICSLNVSWLSMRTPRKQWWSVDAMELPSERRSTGLRPFKLAHARQLRSANLSMEKKEL